VFNRIVVAFFPPYYSYTEPLPISEKKSKKPLKIAPNSPPRKQHIYFSHPHQPTPKKTKELFLPLRSPLDFRESFVNI
jgi:hypothetical protein